MKKDKQGGVKIGKLTDWATFFERDEVNTFILFFILVSNNFSTKVPTVGFADPSAIGSPGWPLRNFLLLLAVQFRVKEVNVVCYRGRTEGIWCKVCFTLFCYF